MRLSVSEVYNAVDVVALEDAIDKRSICDVALDKGVVCVLGRFGK